MDETQNELWEEEKNEAFGETLDQATDVDEGNNSDREEDDEG